MKFLKTGLIIVLWFFIVIASYFLNITTIQKNIDKIALGQGQAFFNEIQTTRAWNAKHGGVYVSITEETQPNPFLDIPNREIYIDSLGIALTKVNPAYMTRQIANITHINNNVTYHITSLKPIRPKNKADNWEHIQLNKFETGTKESFEYIKNDGVFRYMSPLKVNHNCMKCHAKQGYKIGNIRGGISVTIPASNYVNITSDQKIFILIIHIIALFIGVIVIFLFQIYSQKQLVKLHKAKNTTHEKNLELIAAKEKAEESEAKYKNLSNITFEGILIHNKGIILDVNLALEKMFGYSAKEVLGKSGLKMFISEKYHTIITENINKKSELPYEVEGVKKDGSTFPIEIEGRNIISENNNSVRVIAIRDITKRKKIEEQIKKLSTAVEQSSNTIVITDLEGNIEYTNPKFTELTGYTAEEAKGQNPRILNTGTQPKEYYTKMWKSIKEGKTWKGEFHNKTKNGSFFWEYVTITPIKDNKGKTISFLAIKEDFTAKKIAEQEIQSQNIKLKELNATKDKFFSIIAHDLKSPFNLLLGFSSLLLENYSNFNEEKRKEYIKIINDSSLKTYELLENLLTWAHSQSGRIEFLPEKINIKILINEIVLLLEETAKNKNIKILNNTENDLQIFADKNMIDTVLRNLIANAIKFTPKEGDITIKAQNLLNENNDSFTEITVKDSGVGISPEIQSKLFKITENISTKGTEEEAGTGLGLILCKEFVEKHNGEIWVESEVGKGSEFIFTLQKV